MRRCATGSPTCRARITSSGRWSGPIPFPAMVRDFQSVIGREAREQMLARFHGCRTRWWPALGEAPMPWASSAGFSMIQMCGW